MISPDTWSSEDFAELSILARLTFIGLMSTADDYGKGRANVKLIMANLYPYDTEITQEQMESCLTEIAEKMSIIFYRCDKREYYSLVNWSKWQRIDKPAKSIYPDYDENCCELLRIGERKIKKIKSNDGEQISFDDKFNITIDISEAFENIYSKYPRKSGKTKARESFKAYLKGTKKISSTKIKLNHEQINCAVQKYAFECEGESREENYIKCFDVFMNGAVVDYVESSKQGYEKYMENNYGTEWNKLKFIYK